MKDKNLTQGKILRSLLSFAFPVFLALFLQSMYGAVDLFIVGKYAGTGELSGVATGSMFFNLITLVLTSLSVGVTVFVGGKIGEKNPDEAGFGIGTGICIFAVIAVAVTAFTVPLSGRLAVSLHAPAEAFAQTVSYLRICGMGTVFIVSYNVIGAIFRGLGDSRTPLITVAIACASNIAGDLLLVGAFGMGAAGAAIATVAAQAVSVIISLIFISRKKLPFSFSKKHVRLKGAYAKRILRIGTPIAFQELLVQYSFLFIQMTVNSMGVTESAAVGVAKKVCAFLMLVATAYMQSISAFVAQNNGAGFYDRSKKALFYGMGTALIAGFATGSAAFFAGDRLASIFTSEYAVISAAHAYLKAYAIDCVLVAVLFCFVGFFNGCKKTLFVMIQGVVGAFGVRVPFVYLMSRVEGATLFHIALGTPASSVVQIIMFLVAYNILSRKGKIY